VVVLPSLPRYQGGVGGGCYSPPYQGGVGGGYAPLLTKEGLGVVKFRVLLQIIKENVADE